MSVLSFTSSITDKLSDHAARALRFEAGLSKDKKIKEGILNQTLNIYREHDVQPDITVIPLEKLQRALFIRQYLNDSKHALSILKKLEPIYQHHDSPMLSSTTRWIKTLESKTYFSWSTFITDFDSYPKASR